MKKPNGKHPPPVFTAAEFKERIAAMMKGKTPPADKPCVRGPGDKGYAPPAAKNGGGDLK